MQQTFNNGICRDIVIIMPMLSQEVKVENTRTTGYLEQNQDHSIQGIKSMYLNLCRCYQIWRGLVMCGVVFPASVGQSCKCLLMCSLLVLE